MVGEGKHQGVRVIEQNREGPGVERNGVGGV